MTPSDDPIPVAATEGVAARALVWRRAGREMVTVVAKIRFVGGRAISVTPVDPIAPASLVAAKPDDVVPFRPRADVVVGGRDLGPAATLRYQRRGVFLIRKRCRSGAELVVSAQPRLAPTRAARLGSVDPRRLEGLDIDVPAELDPLYFQCAPDDQQIDAIVEGDVVGVDVGVAGAPSIEWAVPSLRVEAHLQVDGRNAGPSPLRADGLFVDADRGTVTLTLRAQMSAPAPESVASILVAASIAAAPVAWVPFPPPRARARRSSHAPQPVFDPRARPPSAAPAPPIAQARGVEGTMAFSPEDLVAAKSSIASAFGAPPPAPPPPSHAPRPFGPPPAPPPPSHAPRPFGPPPPSHAPRFGAPPPPAPAPTRSSVVPAPPAPPGEAKSIDGTMLQSDLDIARVRAMFATPFEAAKKGASPASAGASFSPPGPAGPAPPPPAPPVPARDAPYNVTLPRADEPPPASTPFVRGAFVPKPADPEPNFPTGTLQLGASASAAAPSTPFAHGATTAVTSSSDAPDEPAMPFALRPPDPPADPAAENIGATMSISPADVLAAMRAATADAAGSLPFRAATDEDRPLRLPDLPGTRKEERAPDIGGTMVALHHAVPRKTAARVVPFGPPRVHGGLVPEEAKGKLGKAFLAALKRMEVGDAGGARR